MVLANLDNNLSIRLTDVVHTFSPQRSIMVSYVLYPTTGEIYMDPPEVMRRFYTQWSEQGGPEDASIVNNFLGKDVSVVVAAILAQYVEFANGRPYNAKFSELFEYISSVGIKP